MYRAAAAQRSALLLDSLSRFAGLCGSSVTYPKKLTVKKKKKSERKPHLDTCLSLLAVVFYSSRQCMVSL